MRRALLVSALVVSGLGAALVYGIGAHRSAGVAEPSRQEPSEEPSEARSNSPTQANRSASITRAPSDQAATLRTASPLSRIDDEEGTRKDLRVEATREVQRVYSLLLKHLGLTREKQDALVSLLIEDRIARTTTLHSRGRELNEDERSKRIANVIGHAKLQEFMALERKIRSYADVASIGSLLEQNGVPLSEKQRDELLKILVVAKDQSSTTSRPEVKARSIEALEQAVAAQDEHQRHIMEQVPAVLSSKQVQYLFEQYEFLSERRARTLEMQKKRRADRPDDGLPLFYPAR